MSLIALGVSGGIGAYKAVEVARGLQKQGHDVAAIMTRSARRFVGPLTFEAITRREVITDQWKPGANADIEHIALASSADLLLVAPATANVIGKFANGIADDFLSSLYLATTAPVLMAPAMNTNMFAHPAVVRNLETLTARGVPLRRAGRGLPGVRLDRQGTARRARGDRRGRAAHAARPPGVLAGQRVLVTAGPTLEDIDPVRFIGNRSSGRMGYAIAARGGAARRARHARDRADEARAAAGRRGGAGPQRRRHAPGGDGARAPTADVVVMAAAVADYTVAHPDAQKIAKSDGPLTLTLTPHERHPRRPRASCRRAARPIARCSSASPPRRTTCWPRARQKLDGRSVDLIVANDVSAAGRGVRRRHQRRHADLARRAPRTCRCSRRPRSPRASSTAIEALLTRAMSTVELA